MIDLSNEAMIPLSEAARIVKPGRSGQRTHISTVLRWILNGARGPQQKRIRLEAVRLGGRWLTSREAIQRFAERLTPSLESPAIQAPRTPLRRKRAAEHAARKLEKAAGI
jgi:hypothetical protein